MPGKGLEEIRNLRKSLKKCLKKQSLLMRGRLGNDWEAQETYGKH
jgi:hypothetical protein